MAKLIGVDVGGTFTDVFCVDNLGTRSSFKVPSEADNGFAALTDTRLGELGLDDEVYYSTTLALNRLLSGDLPRIGLVVTAGFRELLETARLPSAADQAARSPLPQRLVPLEWVAEIDARLDASGAERRVIVDADVRAIAARFAASEARVVAICLLHSYVNSDHERELARIFREAAPDLVVVCSSDVLPEQREYERALVTVLNAALIPVLGAHLDILSKLPVANKTWLMQGSGALVSAALGTEHALNTALSGPAAAVVGMRWWAAKCGFENLITLDVGGTSTDVALIQNGEVSSTTGGSVAGFDVPIPLLDVHSIGAGGGSIAYAAADQRWHVGPESAAAMPGPACYARGGLAPTLTDAELVLGRLPNALLSGEIPLDRDRALEVVGALGRSRNLDAIAAARGILEIASHHMCGAIRRVSVKRGFDPRAHALFAIGGAGPLHGAELAELLDMKTVVVPPQPGLAAAWGCLIADSAQDFVRAIGAEYESIDRQVLRQMLEELQRDASAWFDRAAVSMAEQRLQLKLDLRYVGMSHVTIIDCPFDADFIAQIAGGIDRFHEQFTELSGLAWRGVEAVEVVNLRLCAIGNRSKPDLAAPQTVVTSNSSAAASRSVGFLGVAELLDTPILDRTSLAVGTSINGPAIIEQYETTTIVPPTWRANIDPSGNIILRR